MNTYQFCEHFKVKVSVSSEAHLCGSESQRVLLSACSPLRAAPSARSPFRDTKGCAFPFPALLLGSLSKPDPARVSEEFLCMVTNEFCSKPSHRRKRCDQEMGGGKKKRKQKEGKKKKRKALIIRWLCCKYWVPDMGYCSTSFFSLCVSTPVLDGSSW